MADEDDARARRDGIVDPIEDLRTILRRPGNLEFFDHHTVAFCAQLPGLLASGMLLIAHEDLVAGFQLEAIGDVAVALGRIARERDLIASGANKLRQRIAMFDIGIVAPDRVFLRIGLGHLFGLEKCVKHGFKHRQRTRSNCSVVEIDLVAWNHKLLAQRRPVGILILVVKRRQGQWWGRRAAFGKGVSSKSSQGADAGK